MPDSEVPKGGRAERYNWAMPPALMLSRVQHKRELAYDQDQSGADDIDQMSEHGDESWQTRRGDRWSGAESARELRAGAL
ncbi:MAG: hypothetical protein GY835_03740 [bacterium]|nr:hypothetical protein [bacterium]